MRQAIRKLASATGEGELEWELADVMHNLRLAIAGVRAGLTDEEARQALANAADTMRTQSKGLVYDYRSPDPNVQRVIDEVVTVARWHERGEKSLRQVSAAELASCLRLLEGKARVLMGDKPSGTAFLDLVVQSVAQSYLTENGQQAD